MVDPDVVRIIQEFDPRVSGPANQVRHTTQGLQTLGWHSAIYTCHLPGTDAPWAEFIGGVPVRRFRSRGPLLSSYYSPSIWRALRGSSHRILHVHGIRNLVCDGALLLGYHMEAPIVLQPHGMLAAFRHIVSGVAQWPYRTYDATLGRLLAERTHAVIAATASEREDCIAYGFNPERVVVIPVGVSEEFFIKRPPRTSYPGVRLLFVGRVSYDRNVAAIIDAVARLRTDGHQVTLRVVGRAAEMSTFNAGGYRHELAKQVDRLGLSKHVTFVGEKTGTALLAEYAQADLFVYPSRYDNFGQAILEAAAAALPIASTAVGVAREIVRPGVTGEFLMTDGSDIAETVAALMRDRQRLTNMGAEARAAARTYSWPTVCARYSALYTQVLAQEAQI